MLNSNLWIYVFLAVLPKPVDNGSREETRHLAESTPKNNTWAHKRQIRPRPNTSITQSPLTEDVEVDSVIRILNESSIESNSHVSPLVSFYFVRKISKNKLLFWVAIAAAPTKKMAVSFSLRLIGNKRQKSANRKHKFRSNRKQANFRIRSNRK